MASDGATSGRELGPRVQYCLICRSRILDDPRVRKQADLLHRRGLAVVAVGLAGGRSPAPPWPVVVIPHEPWRDGRGGRAATAWRLVRAGARHVVGLALKPLCRVAPGLAVPLFWLSSTARALETAASATAAEVYVAHDWFALPVAARLASRGGAIYCYDSHEYARGQLSERVSWRWLHQPFVAAVEARHMAGAGVLSTVSPGLARLLRTEHGLPTPVQVVRNTPCWEAPPPRAVHDGETQEGGTVVLYQGGIKPSRRLHVVLRSVPLWRSQFRLVLRGPVSAGYRRRLLNLVDELGIAARVRIEEPVPMTEMVRRAAGAHVGLVAQGSAGAQNRHGLPNKLFEYIMAGLAVLVPSLEDMAEVVEHHGVGVVYGALTPGSLAAAVNGLDRQRIEAFRANALRAARRLHWRAEAGPLVERYEALRKRRG